MPNSKRTAHKGYRCTARKAELQESKTKERLGFLIEYNYVNIIQVLEKENEDMFRELSSFEENGVRDIKRIISFYLSRLSDFYFFLKSIQSTI